MATYQKSARATLISNGTELSADSFLIGTELDVSTLMEAWIAFDVAPIDATTPTQATELRIEASTETSGDEVWRTIASYFMSTAQGNSHGVDGTEAAGQTVIEETTTTNLTTTSRVYFRNSTAANSEWHEVVAVTANTSFTIKDGLFRAQTGSTWWVEAEHWSLWLNLAPYLRIRPVVHNNRGGTNRAIALRCDLTTADTFS